MIIAGKERRFAYTIEAMDPVAELCPDNDIRNLTKLFNGTFQETVRNDMALAIILNRAYENRHHYFNPQYQPEYLTEDDFRFFLIPDFEELEKEIAKAMTEGSRQTVQTQPVKSKKK